MKHTKYSTIQMRCLCILISLFSFAGEIKAQFSRISLQPGVAIQFREDKWQTDSKGTNRFTKGGEDATFKLMQDTSTKLIIFSRFINLIPKDPDSLIATLIKDAQKANGTIEKLGQKTILSYTTTYKNQKYNIYQIVIADDMHFVNLALLTKKKQPRVKERIISDLNAQIHLDSPEELDRKEGYPLKPETLDSIVKNRLKEYWGRRNNLTSPIPEATNKALDLDLHQLYSRQMRDGFSYTKFYNTRKQLLSGDIPQKLWLDYYFKHQKFPELKWYHKFETEDFDETEEFAIHTIENLVRTELSWDSQAQIKIKDTVLKSKDNQSIYWLLISGKRFLNSEGQLYVFRFQQKDDTWKIKTYKLDDTLNFKTVQDHSGYGLFFNHLFKENAGLKNESQNVILLEDQRSHRFFLNNAFNDTSSFVSTRDPLLSNYLVSYLIWPSSLHDYNLLNAKFKTDIQKKDNIISAPTESVAPQLRVYCVVPVFGDINNNGIEDCYIPQISNGRVVNVQVLEFDGNRIEELTIDGNLLNKIEKEKIIQQIIIMSLQKYQDETKITGQY